MAERERGDKMVAHPVWYAIHLNIKLQQSQWRVLAENHLFLELIARLLTQRFFSLCEASSIHHSFPICYFCDFYFHNYFYFSF